MHVPTYLLALHYFRQPQFFGGISDNRGYLLDFGTALLFLQKMLLQINFPLRKSLLFLGQSFLLYIFFNWVFSLELIFVQKGNNFWPKKAIQRNCCKISKKNVFCKLQQISKMHWNKFFLYNLISNCFVCGCLLSYTKGHKVPIKNRHEMHRQSARVTRLRKK